MARVILYLFDGFLKVHLYNLITILFKLFLLCINKLFFLCINKPLEDCISVVLSLNHGLFQVLM